MELVVALSVLAGFAVAMFAIYCRVFRVRARLPVTAEWIDELSVDGYVRSLVSLGKWRRNCGASDAESSGVTSVASTRISSGSAWRSKSSWSSPGMIARIWRRL